MENQPIKYKPSERGEIATEVRRRKKPHRTFEAVIRFDSEPTELGITADKTNLKVKNLTPNPRKFSFGKIVGHNKNALEFFAYPLDFPDHVFLAFSRDISAKKPIIILDRYKRAEIWNLTKRIRYFLGLSPEKD